MSSRAWRIVAGKVMSSEPSAIRSCPAVRAPTMTLATAALSLAQALASALTGQVAERVGVSAAMWLPFAAAVLLLVLGGANVVVERRTRR